MFAKLSKWVDGLKAQRNDARAALEQAEELEAGHGHTHDHLDGTTHAHDRDFDHRHDHT
jgi:hypothetical protein